MDQERNYTNNTDTLFRYVNYQPSNQQGVFGFYREIDTSPVQTNHQNDNFPSYSSINQQCSSSFYNNTAQLASSDEYTTAPFSSGYRNFYDHIHYAQSENIASTSSTDFHNLPSQIENQNERNYRFMNNQHHFHQISPISPVPMETVIKPATESEKAEPSLCEILTNAEDNYSIEEMKTKTFDVIIPHDDGDANITKTTIAISCTYPLIYEEQSFYVEEEVANNETLTIEHPDPVVTFIYESPPKPSPPLNVLPEKLDLPEPVKQLQESTSAVLEKTTAKTAKITNPVKIRKALRDDKKVKCECCDKTFNGNSYYLQHFKTHHSGEKRFKCMKCGKKFFELEFLDRHFEKHVTKTNQCHQCPKMFAHKYDLTRHMITHLSKLPHECQFCFKGFVRRDHMKQHEFKCKKSPDFLNKKLLSKKNSRKKNNTEEPL